MKTTTTVENGLTIITNTKKNGDWAKFTYDECGRLIKGEWSSGQWAKYTYNENGAMTLHEQSNGRWRKWEYDENGKPTSYEDSTGLSSKKLSPSIDPSKAEVVRIERKRTKE